MLVYLLLVLQDLLACCELPVLQLHLLLLGQLLQLLGLHLHLLHLLVKPHPLPVHKAVPVPVAHRCPLLPHLAQVVDYLWLLDRRVGYLVGLPSPSSHFGCHFLGPLEVLQPYHPRITGLDFLVFDGPILPHNLPHLLFVHLLDHFEELSPLFLVNPWKVPFLHSLFDIPLGLLLLLTCFLPLCLPRINVVTLPIIVRLVLVVDLLVLKF